MSKIMLLLTLLATVFIAYGQETKFQTKFHDAIPVLNMGTFHMGYTPDANKIDFDEHSKENIRQIHEIAKKIATFQPTVLIVETNAEYQENLERLYKDYLKNPEMELESPNEVELLAYEVGRLSGAKRIYGIDYKEEYNYALYSQLSNKIDSTTIPKYGEMMMKNEQKYWEVLGREPNVLDMLVGTNQPEYLDFLININADMLMYVSTKENSEGADEAAKFYHRNMVMFSNLNQIEFTEDDRVFILMGATHTAFLNDFIKRSPKYKLVAVFDYLN